MRINQKASLIGLMVRLISSKKTGTPNEFAQRLGISRSNLYQIIEEFNDIGVEIEYNRSILSFYFPKNKKIIVQTPIVIIDNDEQQKITGGFLYPITQIKSSNFCFLN